MTDIYDKLEIPEPSADLESRIISAANIEKKRSFFPRLAVVAACLLISVLVLQPEQNTELASSGYLTEVAFFEEHYGFVDDIEFSENIGQKTSPLEDIEFFDEQFGFADEIS